jgi:hypothetical protein
MSELAGKEVAMETRERRTFDQTSASQVKDWEICERYWFHKSILRIQVPTHPSAAHGSLIHESLETYLTTGKIVPNEEQAAFVNVAKPYLPPVGAALIEQEFRLPTYEGGPAWLGYIDVLETQRVPVRVLDHKTTSQFRHAKTPNELANDTQMGAYAYYAFEAGHAKDLVEVSHLYLLTSTKTPKAMYVSALVSERDVRALWKKQIATVKQMAVAATVKDADELYPNTNRCGNIFGRGCPFRSRCGLVPMQKGKNDMSTPDSKLSFLEQINAKKNGAHAVTPLPPPVVLVPATPAPVLVVAIKASEANVQANGHCMLVGDAAQIYARVKGMDCPLGSGFQTTVQNLQAAGIVVVQDVVATMASPAPALPFAVVQKAPAAPMAAFVPVSAAVLAPDAASRETPIQVPGLGPVEPVAPKRRGRPKKEGVVVEAVVETVLPHTMPVGEIVEERTPVVQARPRLGLELYVDSYPTKDNKCKHDVTMYEDWIAPMMQRVAEDNGVQDYRLLQFGSGKALLAIEIRNRIVDVPPVLVVNSMSVGAHEAIDILVPFADRVVKGLKG